MDYSFNLPLDFFFAHLAGYALVDEYGSFLLLSVVYPILFAFYSHFIADTINWWYPNPINRLYSNTSSETLTSDSRSYGYKDQRDMFYLEKYKVLSKTR